MQYSWLKLLFFFPSNFDSSVLTLYIEKRNHLDSLDNPACGQTFMQQVIIHPSISSIGSECLFIPSKRKVSNFHRHKLALSISQEKNAFNDAVISGSSACPSDTLYLTAALTHLNFSHEKGFLPLARLRAEFILGTLY